MHIDTFAEIEEKAIVLDSDNNNYNNLSLKRVY